MTAWHITSHHITTRIWTELDFELEGDMAEDITEYNKFNASSIDATWSQKKSKKKNAKGKLEPKTPGDKALLGFIEQVRPRRPHNNHLHAHGVADGVCCAQPSPGNTVLAC